MALSVLNCMVIMAYFIYLRYCFLRLLMVVNYFSLMSKQQEGQMGRCLLQHSVLQIGRSSFEVEMKREQQVEGNWKKWKSKKGTKLFF